MKEILKKVYLTIRKEGLNTASFLAGIKKLRDTTYDEEIRKILFIRIDRIGDLVLSTPVLKAIKKAYPLCELKVLASPGNRALLMNNPFVDTVEVYDHKASLAAKAQVIRKLKQASFDLAIDPYADYELETALIAFLSKARRRIGFAAYGREVFFNLPATRINAKQHFIDLSFDVVTPVGINADDRVPEIFVDESERRWAKDWLLEHSIDSQPIIGIHPGGHYKTQRWFPERFAEIACLIHKKYNVKPIIFGGPREANLIADIHSLTADVAKVFSADNLRQFAAILSCCNLLICNNSGPLHMAVALGVPTISFMGPTIKERWMPQGSIHAVLRIHDLPCIGCNAGHCRIQTHDCMRLITPDMVMDCVSTIL